MRRSGVRFLEAAPYFDLASAASTTRSEQVAVGVHHTTVAQRARAPRPGTI